MYRVVIYIIALILLISGLSKIYNPGEIESSIRNLTGLSGDILLIPTLLLPSFELILALLLLTGTRIKETTKIVSALFLLFLLFSFYAIVKNIETDCGCFGGLVESKTNIFMLIRNAFLFIATIYLVKYAGVGRNKQQSKQ